MSREEKPHYERDPLRACLLIVIAIVRFTSGMRSDITRCLIVLDDTTAALPYQSMNNPADCRSASGVECGGCFRGLRMFAKEVRSGCEVVAKRTTGDERRYLSGAFVDILAQLVACGEALPVCAMCWVHHEDALWKHSTRVAVK